MGGGELQTQKACSAVLVGEKTCGESIKKDCVRGIA